MTALQDLLARDGRLSDLTLDRYAVGDLSAEETSAVDAHLAAHPDEQARLSAVRAALQAPLPPLLARPTAPTAEVIPLFSRRRLGPALGGALAVAAATLLIVNLSGTSQDRETFVARGDASLSLEVMVQGRDDAIAAEGRVQAGDRLMFQVTPREAGHLLVLGVDGAGSVYPWHPPGEGAQSLAVTAGEVVQPSTGLQVDATPGAERIVGLLCAAPIRYAEVRGALASAAALAGAGGALPGVRQGCAQAVVLLQKTPRP